MYQSELVLRCTTGETFREAIGRLLSTDPSAPFFAGLYAVPATGHLEHHHGGTGTEENHGDHGDHGSHDHTPQTGVGHGHP